MEKIYRALKHSWRDNETAVIHTRYTLQECVEVEVGWFKKKHKKNIWEDMTYRAGVMDITWLETIQYDTEEKAMEHIKRLLTPVPEDESVYYKESPLIN